VNLQNTNNKPLRRRVERYQAGNQKP